MVYHYYINNMTYLIINEIEHFIFQIKVYDDLVPVIEQYLWGTAAGMYHLFLAKVDYLGGTQIRSHKELAVCFFGGVNLWTDLLLTAMSLQSLIDKTWLHTVKESSLLIYHCCPHSEGHPISFGIFQEFCLDRPGILGLDHPKLLSIRCCMSSYRIRFVLYTSKSLTGNPW